MLNTCGGRRIGGLASTIVILQMKPPADNYAVMLKTPGYRKHLQRHNLSKTLLDGKLLQVASNNQILKCNPRGVKNEDLIHMLSSVREPCADLAEFCTYM
jgi:hypothetical protein